MMIDKELAEGQFLYSFWMYLFVARNLFSSGSRILREMELELE